MEPFLFYYRKIFSIFVLVHILSSCAVKLNNQSVNSVNIHNEDTAPNVLSVISTNADGGYVIGDTITIQVIFSKTVFVDTSGGIPYITLEMGVTDKNANYISGSGSTTLSFTYTLVSGDSNPDLDYTHTAALSLNGSTIMDSSGQSANLTLSTIGLTGSISDDQAIVICAYSSFGAGTSSDPFLICTASQFVAIGATPGNWNKNYKLLADIDLTGYESTAAQPSAKGPYTVIGNLATAFTGTFDGNNKKISNFNYTDPAADNVGLFGVTKTLAVFLNLKLDNFTIIAEDQIGSLIGQSYSGAIVVNVNATNVNVIADSSSGGLVGQSSGGHISISNSSVSGDISISGGCSGGFIGEVYYGDINNSFFSGTLSLGVSASNNGGFVGYAEWTKIRNSYVTGVVSGFGDLTGGFVGDNLANIYNSYFNGTISVDGWGIGGFVGGHYGYTIENSYAAGSVSGTGGVGGFAGDEDANIENSFSTADVNGNGGLDIGRFSGYQGYGFTAGNNHFYSGSQFINCSGYCNTTGTYTAHASLSDFYDAINSPLDTWDFLGSGVTGTSNIWIEQNNNLPKHTWSENPSFTAPFSGAGTMESPFLISTVAEFLSIGDDALWMGAYFKLTSNLDFTGQTFVPIGSKDNPFKGNFDGQKFTLTNITCNKPGEYYIGVFGYIVGATIQRLYVTNSTFSGTSYIGGLAGYSSARILESSFQGTVTASSSSAGGLVGRLMSGYIKKSSAIATVTGGTYVGGLTGYSSSGMVVDSFSNSTVIGNGAGPALYVGGIGGYLEFALISRSYSSGSVNGKRYSGGLFGYLVSSIATDNFSISSMQGNTNTFISRSIAYSGGSTLTNNYVFATSSFLGCSGSCNSVAHNSHAAVTSFYSSSSAPMSGVWDFVNDWIQVGGSTPILIHP